MQLDPDWKTILTKAWSVRFMALAVFFTFLEIVLPFFELSFPPLAYATLFGLTACAAFVSRVVVQRGVYRSKEKDE